MLTEDGFDPAHPLAPVLPDHTEQQGIGNLYDGAVSASRVLKAGILIATATATGIAILSAGDPVALFAELTASLVGNSSLHPGTNQPTSTVQSAAGESAGTLTAADAQALPPTATDAPTRGEIAAPEGASASDPPSEDLLKRFQAWAAEQDPQADAGPVSPAQDEQANVGPIQSVQDAPAQLAQNAPAPVTEDVRVQHRPMQKHRLVRAVHNARAEMHTQNFRKRVQRVQSARAERPPIQDARAQAQPVQSAPAPSFLQTFGLHN